MKEANSMASITTKKFCKPNVEMNRIDIYEKIDTNIFGNEYDKINQRIIDLNDTMIFNALIELGWKPPKNK